MKFSVDKTKINLSGDQILRKAGYGFIRDSYTGKESYVRRLGGYHYPRLHMYVTESSNSIDFNLHLDQKQASYKGQHMHNAEYEGPVVENEILRLKQFILSLVKSQSLTQRTEPEEKKAWYKFW